MDIIGQILEILKFLLPAIAVIAAAYMVLNKVFENEQYKRKMDIRLSGMKTITPIRLQAYERLILFLERISPENLVMRVNKKGMSARQLRDELIRAVRGEYEHNVTQQIYVSVPAWSMIKNSKEETIKLINLAASKTEDDASAVELSRMIFEIITKVENFPVYVAIDYIKKEIRKQF